MWKKFGIFFMNHLQTYYLRTLESQGICKCNSYAYTSVMSPSSRPVHHWATPTHSAITDSSTTKLHQPIALSLISSTTELCLRTTFLCITTQMGKAKISFTIVLHSEEQTCPLHLCYICAELWTPAATDLLLTVSYIPSVQVQCWLWTICLVSIKQQMAHFSIFINLKYASSAMISLHKINYGGSVWLILKILSQICNND